METKEAKNGMISQNCREFGFSLEQDDFTECGNPYQFGFS